MAMPRFPSEISQDPEQSRVLLEAEVEQRHEVSPQEGRWLRGAGLAGVLLAACVSFVMLTTTAGPVPWTSSPPMQALRPTTVHEVSAVMELSASCSASEKWCGASPKCVDVTANMDHCGNCSTRCGQGQRCIGGRCKCLTLGFRACAHPIAGEPATCAHVCCDDRNCGSCNNQCETGKGQKCLEGRCQCMEPTPNACFNGGTLDKCVNFMNDNSNCGSCGKTCAAGQKCRGGFCQCIDTDGTGKITACGNQCVDVLTNKTNCGQCGTVCPSSTTCISGVCQCELGSGLCPISGSPPRCFDLQTDSGHCGRCSNPCRGDQECKHGNCECRGCTSPCGSTCVDTQTDRQHCGGCGRKCGDLLCIDGTCQCTTGFTFCNNSISKCADLSADKDNCGTCGNACGSGQTCTAGSCQCPLGHQLCSGVCINFLEDPDNCGTCGKRCREAQTCRGGLCQCRDVANTPDACGNPVGSLCTNRMTDKNNCGKCNNKCPAAQACKDGYCQCVNLTKPNACGMPLGSQCVDFNSDPDHCGGCDTQCSAGQQCLAGICQCVDTSTSDPQLQKIHSCGTPVGGYTCVSLQSDEQNCGTCGNQCPAGQNCTYGLCECSDRAKSLCHGKCVDFKNDSLNCGGCGKICPHQKVCNNGNCECVDNTPSGKINACGNKQKGFACVNFMNDENHCGSCNKQCPSAQTCIAGSCQCTDGLKACGPLCVDISKDPLNCGSCGNLCPTGRPCLGGVCQGKSGDTCSGDQCFCTSESPCTAGLSVLADGDFSSCTDTMGNPNPTGQGGYGYVCPLSSKWTCAGHVVCIKSGSIPWGSPDAIYNSQYLLGLQRSSSPTTSITQEVKVVKGTSYTLSLYAASRTKGQSLSEAYDLATLKITVQGQQVYSGTLYAQPLDKISITFVAGSSKAAIVFSNVDASGDRTVFLSNVAVTPNQVPVADWDFSGCSAFLPSDSVPGYTYTCPSSSWSCSTIVAGTKGAVCIKSGNTYWGSPQAAGSSQYVVGLQRWDAMISQTVNVIAGTSYTLKVYAASRGNNQAMLEILVDGVSQSLSTLPALTSTPGDSLREVSCTFIAQTSTATISFLNKGPPSAVLAPSEDQTVFLSNVIITTTVSCESGLGTCGVGLTDLASDPQNCGACGNVCPDSNNALCSNGHCLCKDSEQVLCGVGAAAVCKAVNTDANCGGCGIPCALGTQTCINGRCEAVATGDQVKCSCDGQCSNSVKCYNSNGEVALSPAESTCAAGSFCTLNTSISTFLTADSAKEGARDFHCKAWQPLLTQDRSCPFNPLGDGQNTQNYTQPGTSCSMDVREEYFQKLQFTHAGYQSTTSDKPVTGKKYMMFAQWRRCSTGSQASCTAESATEAMNICWAQSALPLHAAGRFEGLNQDARRAATQPADASYKRFHGESTPNHKDPLCYFNGAGNNANPGEDGEDRRLTAEDKGGKQGQGNANPSWNCMGQTASDGVLQNNGIRGPLGQYWYSVKWYTKMVSTADTP